MADRRIEVVDGRSIVVQGTELLAPLVAAVQANAGSAAANAAALDRSLPSFAADVVAVRQPLLSREPIADDYLAGEYGGLTVTARGEDLAAGVGGFETWIATQEPLALQLRFALYSRNLSGAADDGAGAAGDTLLFGETRQLNQIVPDFIRDGRANRVVIDFLSQVEVSPTKLYLLLITVEDASGLVPFSFLHGQGVLATDPAYPQANGYYREIGGAWVNFDADATAAFRWLSAARPGASALTADILALGKQARSITVGAPEGLLTTSNGAAAAGIWWNEWPLVQGGLVTRLFGNATKAGFVTFHFGERLEDGTIVPRRSASVQIAGSGTFSFDAGDMFAAFAAEAGWLIGIEQALDVVAYSEGGNSWRQEADPVPTYYRGFTIAMGAEVLVSALPVAPIETKRRRTLLWRETLDSTLAPRGWAEDPAIIYASNGMTISTGTPPGWAVRVSTGRYVRTDKRVTRVWFTTTAASNRLAVVTAAPADAQFIDAGNSPSGVEVDGAANRLRIKARVGIGDGSAGDPGDIASIPLGFSIASNHDYMLEWAEDGTVHSAVLVDLTTNARSPVLTSGDPDFSGVDTPEGFQNGSLSFVFVAGRPRITATEVLHDGPSPQVYVAGDSISKQVYMPAADSWPSLLADTGLSVLRSAQPGGTTLGALVSAQIEIEPSRPRAVIAALGANDVLLSIPIANVRWAMQSIIDLARRVGALIVLTRLHPIPGEDASAFNAMVDALAAGEPDILVWRWDRALTVNGDGSTPNTALLNGDLLHPNEAGAQAQFLRLLGDAPGVAD